MYCKHSFFTMHGKRSNLFLIALVLLAAAIGRMAFADDIAGVKKYDPLPVSGEIAKGGYVLVLEHVADRSAGSDCEDREVLTEKQKSLAQAIGAAFGKARIPVDRILTSTDCAARQTAELLGLGNVSRDPDLDPVTQDTTDPDEVARLRNMLSVVVPEGSNVLLVSHGGNIQRLLKTSVSSPPGTLHALRVAGNAVNYAGSIEPRDWTAIE